ncbi:ABC transporter ATP-binding protein [Sulfitobacter aestuarii]|uniref:ABC transporter ATP-binding protein n=1 Tax=Sulfitobacter aestuarii TaxID=2161676 RepID=A0ABW5U0D9_9RHOB
MIRLEHVHKRFDGNDVLRGVDLELRRGRSLVVIGASGSGKSVLMKSILGLVRPDRGRITFDGELLAGGQRRMFLDRFGMLFQAAALFDSLPVWQNVAFRLLRRMPRAEAHAIAIRKLDRVGLSEDVADRLPAELSGGMQKRAGLARAIAADPEILFFDEPTTGLDPVMAGVINRLIRDIVSETGAMALTITHDMTSVRTIADEVALLQDGVIHWQGDVAAMDRASDPQLTRFITGQQS